MASNINLLYTLIQEDPDILEHIDSIPFVETPLHIAASVGHLQFATEIMRLKPSFAWKLNQHGFSPTHLAMQRGQEEMVLRFVDIDKELVRIKGREGLTPLHLASQTGKVDLLAHFCSACPVSIEDVTVWSKTALHIAAQNQQYEALEVLVSWLKRACHKGSGELEKTIPNWKDEAGNTVLHISALMNDSKAVQLLVNTKVCLNARNWGRQTALDVAQHAEIKVILSRAGAKGGSSVNDAPTFADHLRSMNKDLWNLSLSIRCFRTGITEEHRNASLVVAVLVATVIFQVPAESPPDQADAGVNNVNTTSLNSTATDLQRNARTMGLTEVISIIIYFLKAISLAETMMIIYILTPYTGIRVLLMAPVLLFFLSDLAS